MSEHTPGPWGVFLNEDTNQFEIFHDEGRGYGRGLAQIIGERGKFQANARLIAAAPDLLTSLVECADELEIAIRANYEGLLDYPHNREKLERDLEPVARARAAIAKARGEE